MKAKGTAPTRGGSKGSKGGRWRTALLLSLIPGVVGILLTLWPPTSGLERSGLDLLFLLRGQLPQPPGVAVVAIDDPSFIEWELDPLLPWPRGLHGELVRILKDAGARSVAFDVLFEGPGDPSQDEAFRDGLAETKFVVLGATVDQIEDPRFRSMRLIEPWDEFAKVAAAVAEVNLPTDRDGVIRTTWLSHGSSDSLALAAYQVATGDNSQGDEKARLIDYYGPPRTIPTVSLYQALDPATFLPPDFFRDRIVFVGLSQAASVADMAKDSFLTPYRGGRGAATYGVEIHATIAANLLEGRRIRLLDRKIEAIFLLLAPVFASLIFMYARPLWGGVALVFLTAIPWITAYVAFTTQQLWLPVILPTAVQLPLAYLISILWYYLTTVRDRERIRRAFSFYLSPAMTNRIAEDPDSLNLGGEEIVATALFSDIQGFTSIAEGQSAPETATMLNEYFSEITRDIFEADGTLIKYIGDAVFAIWGAPIYMDEHATLACRTAIGMSRARARLGDTRAGQLITRIGVHTGPMLVGNLGSTQRFDYTAIGDAVNLAARLEGLNKAFGTYVLASADSFSRTDGSIVGRSLGMAKVVGRSEPVEIYELVGLAGEETRIGAAGLALFAEALERFRAADFAEAERRFRELAAAPGGDGPSDFYLGHIAELSAGPPASDWDGVIRFTKK